MFNAIPNLQTLETELGALIQERLLDLPAGFTPGTNLYQAGLDSMGIMQLLLAIEDRFGILLPEADVSQKNFCNLTNLSGLLRERLVERSLQQS
jgi:acyl carrier protein